MDRNQDFIDPDKVIYCEKHKYEVKKICTMKECKDRFICIMCRHDNSHERFVSRYAEILEELLASDSKNLIIKAMQASNVSKSRDVFKQVGKKLNVILTKNREKMEQDFRKQYEEVLKKCIDIKINKVFKKCQILKEESVDDVVRNRELMISKIRESLRTNDDSDQLYDYFEKFFSGGILNKIIEDEFTRFEKYFAETFEDSKKHFKRILDAIAKDEIEQLVERKEEKNVMNQKAFNNSVIDFRNQSLVDGGLEGSVTANKQEIKKIENFLEINQHKLIAYWENWIGYYTCFFANKECKEESRKPTRDKCYSVCKVIMPCLTYDFLLTLEPQNDIIKLWNIKERDLEKVTDLQIQLDGITRQLTFINDTLPQTFRRITDYEAADLNVHSYSSLNFVRINNKNRMEVWEIVLDIVPKIKKESFISCSMVAYRDFDGEITYCHYDKSDSYIFVVVKELKIFALSFDTTEKKLDLSFEPLLIPENHGKILNFAKLNFDQYCYLTSMDRLVTINIEPSGLKVEALNLYRAVSWGAVYGLNKYAVCYFHDTLKKYCVDILEVKEKKWKNTDVILDDKMGLGTLLGDRKEIIYDRGGVINFFTGR